MFIRIQNDNDNVPLTEKAVYYPSVPESSPPGVKVLQLMAEDGDDDPLQRITYRITSGNPEGYFTINSTSGKNRIIIIYTWNFFFIHFYSAPMLLLSLSIEFGFFFYCVLQASHKDVGTKAKCNNRNVLSDSEENLIFTLNKSVDSKKRKQKFAANMFVCLYNAQTV